MRIYVPATLDELETVAVSASGVRWSVPPRRAHAVTPALPVALPDEDTEGLEYAAFLAAAADALPLVAGSTAAPPLRLVVSIEVPDAVATAGVGLPGPDAPPSAVELSRPLEAAVVAVHVDEPEAADDVRALVAAVDAGDDDAAEAAAGRAAERDLLWYDVTEIREIPTA